MALEKRYRSNLRANRFLKNYFPPKQFFDFRCGLFERGARVLIVQTQRIGFDPENIARRRLEHSLLFLRVWAIGFYRRNEFGHFKKDPATNLLGLQTFD